MSFLSKIILPQKQKNLRKEQDSFIIRYLKLISLNQTERTSAFTLQGSLTLEATIVTVFFFFGILSLCYLVGTIYIQTTVRNALCYVGRNMAEKSYMTSGFSDSYMMDKMKEVLGAEKINQYQIDCSKSKTQWGTSIMDLSVCYQIKIPVPFFDISPIIREETLRIKGWTGKENSSASTSSNDMVYVTDYGMVYHKDLQCTYLELSIKRVSEANVTDLRNANGEQYKTCSFCKKKNQESTTVYITDHGNRYHRTLDCQGLQRNIYAVPVKDIYGLGGCSKCVE